GQLDPFIGSQQLPAGTGGATDATARTYFVAVSSNAQLPTALSATFGTVVNGVATPTGSNLIRLEPIDSIKRIVEDHIGSDGFKSGNNTIGSTTGQVLPIGTSGDVANNVVPYVLSDVSLFALNGSNLVSVDPFTGASNYGIANLSTLPEFQPFGGSIKMRSDGVLFGYAGINSTAAVAANIGELVRIDP